jgi:CHAD domain-containing protein
MREYVKVQTAILLRRLAYQVSRAGKSADPDAVHDVRVAIRRFSGCLRTFSRFYPPHSWKPMRRRTKVVMDAAGAVRDLDIALHLLNEAGIGPRSALVAHVRDARRKAATDLEREIRLWKSRAFSRKWRSRLGL